MKAQRKPAEEMRPVYLRLRPELVAWVDQEAKRQRRSRAYVISQACGVLRAVLQQLEAERRA